MKFWDSSALVPLLVEEPSTSALANLYNEDSLMIAWWGADTECVSALARLERDGYLSPSLIAECLKRLQELRQCWQEVQPAETVKEAARRLLRVHNLRAADALQLAAAMIVSENRPSSLEFVCLDERLILAAQREGFSLTKL